MTAAAVARMNWVKAVALCFVFVVCLADTETFGQAVLLGDLDESEDLTINEYSSLIAGDGRLYFIGSGNELWTSATENPEDLVMLKKFSSLSNLTVAGSKLFFTADDGVNGTELWRSEGTIESTVIVKDIRAGNQGSAPEDLTNLRGVLYFVANDGIHGKELWKTNGSPGSTALVKDIMPRAGNSNPAELTAVGTTLYFSAKDATHGTELWKSNGTATGTSMVKDIRTGTGVSSTPSELVNVYGTIFFVAADAAAGRELWKSDGTAAGTVLVKDIAPGPANSRIDNGTAVYRTLFFTATDGIHGQELWKSDGTAAGTVMVKDMTPGSAGSQGEGLFSFNMGNFTNIYGTLFFTAYLHDEYYLWKSNGTAAGTIPIRIIRGPGIFQPFTPFIYHKDRIYYFDRISEIESDALGFYSMDLNGDNPEFITEFVQYDAYNVYYPGVALVGDNFYLSGQPDYFYGFKMLISDGTREGTRWIEDVGTTTEGSNPKLFTPMNGKLYFIADDDWYGVDLLYETNGTPEGTEFVLGFEEEVGLVQDVDNTIFATVAHSFVLYKADLAAREVTTIYQDYDNEPVSILTHAGDQLFFATQGGSAARGGELWTSDGTASGTQMLHDFYSVRGIYPVGSSVIVIGVNEDISLDVWVSDGTMAGTRMVAPIRSTWGLDNPYNPHAILGNVAYFTANDGLHGSELWRSDGTAGGTYMIKDLNTHDTPSQDDIRSLIAFKDELYISAFGEDNNWSLYKSDGTGPGTVKLNDMDPIVNTVATGDQLLLFTSSYMPPGQLTSDIWITDGSPEGTKMIADLNEPHGKFSHAVVDGVAYFSFMEGGELWRSDGTECGTFIVNVGSRGASPIAALNEILVFGSYDPQAGFEPHAYNTSLAPGTPCSRSVALEQTSPSFVEESVFPGYPNPFKNDFSFRFSGHEGETTRVQVFTLYGEPVEDIGEVESNVELRMGQAWRKGIYVLQVMKGGSMERYRIVKE